VRVDRYPRGADLLGQGVRNTKDTKGAKDAKPLSLSVVAFRVDPVPNAPRRHAPAYHDLNARLAGTDRLIDQIVYKLYGLTEEEIAIVEPPR